VTVGSVAGLVLFSEITPLYFTLAVGGASIMILGLLTGSNQYRFVKQGLASLLLFPTGALLAGGVTVLSAQLSGIELTAPVLMLGFFLSGVGLVTLAWSDSTMFWAIPVISLGIASLIIPVCALIIVFVFQDAALLSGARTTTGAIFRWLLEANTQVFDGFNDQYTGAALTLGISLLSISAVLSLLVALPLREIAGPNRWPEWKKHLATVRRTLKKVRIITLLLVPIVFLLGIRDFQVLLAQYVPTPLLQLPIIFGALQSLRLFLIVVAATAFTGRVSVLLLKRIARLEQSTISSWIVPQIGGLGTTVLILVYAQPVVSRLLSGSLIDPPFVVQRIISAHGAVLPVLGMAIAACVAVQAISVVIEITRYGILSDGTTSAVVTSTAIFLLGTGSILLGVMPIVSYILIAGSLIIWDIESHGASLSREIGSRSRIRQSTLVHAGGSAVVASLGVLVASGSLLVVSKVTVSGVSATIALIASFIGITALAFGLRIR